MAKAADKHRIDDQIHSVLKDITEPALLTEGELLRQLASLGQIMQEPALRTEMLTRAQLRLRQLNIEHRRRLAMIF